ncbi:hypothetical protein DSCW_52760 [Desulfosarcina widdelii]|uniref:Cyclic nucleotide-binding domain-containing protein n=1 Tax=Desulfosarcina widdelii TaxID=947919 RepID=A0A5K7ZCG1_9BACT|nr:cyclic nucleotide-binding domain-containing protein [Desulfosarcina widdelii]BBO77859.1 hypothetical protein DSCW_52760 [Desulfosarcina widdelii]
MIETDFLNQIDIFGDFSSTMREKISSIAEFKEYNAGESVTIKKSTASHLFVIMEGMVSLEVPGITGNRAKSEIIGPGEIIGYSALMNVPRRKYQAEAKALTPLKLVRIPTDALNQLFYSDFEMGFYAMRNIAQNAIKRLRKLTYPVTHPSSDQ